MNQFFTIGDIAKAVGLTPEGVRWWVAQGSVRPVGSTVGGIALYTESEVEALRKARAASDMARRHDKARLEQPASIEDGTFLSVRCTGTVPIEDEVVRLRVPWLQTCDAALAAGVTPSAIRRAVRDGRLVAAGTERGQYLFRREDITAYVATCRKWRRA